MNNCPGNYCDKKMCYGCVADIFYNIQTIKNLPYVLFQNHIVWACDWNCIYVYVSNEYRITHKKTIKISKNKQQNILQSIQFPFIVNKYLSKNLTKIIVEYAEFLLQEN